jgi:hypothetical protein
MPLRKGHFEMAISQQAKSLKIKSSLSSPWRNVERLLRQQRQFAKKLIKREILMTEFRN